MADHKIDKVKSNCVKHKLTVVMLKLLFWDVIPVLCMTMIKKIHLILQHRLLQEKRINNGPRSLDARGIF